MEKQSELIPTEVIIWPWSENDEGKHPVRLRLSYKGKRKYYPINFQNKKLYLSQPEFDLIEDSKINVRGENKRIRDSFSEIKGLAHTAIRNATKNNRPFTWERFESEFLIKESGKGFLSLWSNHLETLREEKRIGTYRTYKSSYEAFKKFRKEKELSAFDISTDLLKAFEAHLQEEGCGRTTVGIYMRSLKVIYNLAADENSSLMEFYPFAKKQTDRKRYKIKTGSGHKGEALEIDQLQKLIAIKTEKGSLQREAQLLWLFSFYSQGMNLTDVCMLKYENTNGENLRYVRAKTKNTELRESVIEVPISDSIRSIIAEIGNPEKKAKDFVFPIIPNGLASNVKRRKETVKTHEERIDEIIRQKIKMINARLKSLCEDNDLPTITTYWARHSYASLMKASGESVDMIRELLGHSDVATTEHYLKRFATEKKRAANERLNSILKVS